MKRTVLAIALILGAVCANAQETTSTGDLYQGLTRKIAFERMIPPHGLEITYDKTVHIIFPSAVRYVDLGSPNLIAGKADGAENVIRVKATVKDFHEETNMSVITEDGAFYTFNVKYANEPLLLNVEMADFIHDGESVNRPNNAMEVYLKELGSENPMLVRLIMKSIHKEDRRAVKHIGSKSFGIQYLLKGLYSHNGLLYFHTELRNKSNVPFDIDFITFKSWTRRSPSRRPCRSRYCFRCVPTTTPPAWRSRRANERYSPCKSSPSPMTSISLWRCTRRTEEDISPSSWRMKTLCVRGKSTNSK